MVLLIHIYKIVDVREVDINLKIDNKNSLHIILFIS